MVDQHIKTLTDFSRWLSKSGGKYPRPGCSAAAPDIIAAIRYVSEQAKTSAMIHPDDLLAMLSLANAGAASIGKKPSTFKCISRISRLVKRIKKCQDTESQQTIQHD